MTQPHAIIVGSDGQDGKLLTEYLRAKNYGLTLVTRKSHDITETTQVEALVRKTSPSEIYYLAAYHHSSEMERGAAAELLEKSIEINATAWGYFLDAAAQHQKNCRLFYASSCHVFEEKKDGLIDEHSPVAPSSAYAISKQAGMELCRRYRKQHSLHASCGILFNHESVYRSEAYLSKKIAKAAAQAARNQGGSLRIGNLEAVADWGAGEDYVIAMHNILQLRQPDDYIVATGVSHSVREWLDTAFRHVGLDYKNYVTEDSSLLQKQPERRIGDSTKLRKATHWQPKISFTQMIHRLVDFELAVLS